MPDKHLFPNFAYEFGHPSTLTEGFKENIYRKQQ